MCIRDSPNVSTAISYASFKSSPWARHSKISGKEIQKFPTLNQSFSVHIHRQLAQTPEPSMPHTRSQWKWSACILWFPVKYGTEKGSLSVVKLSLAHYGVGGKSVIWLLLFLKPFVIIQLNTNRFEFFHHYRRFL